jgi:hypothetical protein
MQRRLAADVAGGPAAVVDDDLLAEPLRQPLSDQARREVDRAARRERRDQLDRAGRVGLRLRQAR